MANCVLSIYIVGMDVNKWVCCLFAPGHNFSVRSYSKSSRSFVRSVFRLANKNWSLIAAQTKWIKFFNFAIFLLLSIAFGPAACYKMQCRQAGGVAEWIFRFFLPFGQRAIDEANVRDIFRVAHENVALYALYICVCSYFKRYGLVVKWLNVCAFQRKLCNYYEKRSFVCCVAINERNEVSRTENNWLHCTLCSALIRPA